MPARCQDSRLTPHSSGQIERALAGTLAPTTQFATWHSLFCLNLQTRCGTFLAHLEEPHIDEDSASVNTPPTQTVYGCTAVLRCIIDSGRGGLEFLWMFTSSDRRSRRVLSTEYCTKCFRSPRTRRKIRLVGGKRRPTDAGGLRVTAFEFASKSSNSTLAHSLTQTQGFRGQV